MYRLSHLLSACLITSCFVALAIGDDIPIYKNPSAPLEQRVEALFQAMTPDERLTLLSGTGFGTHAVPRLGVPAMSMADASEGVRGGSETTRGPATVFSTGVLLAATWDTDLASRIGYGVGDEALNKGTGLQILLGPGVNIMRSPMDGRASEYLGEDPYVSSRMAVAYIEGLQKTGCSACVKHYACNNQEFERGSVDVRVDERALREIYTPAFIAAVKEAKVWTAMSAYNQVNGSFSSANWYLQKQILKDEAGFDGIIMTDWGGLHSTLAIDNGCDLEMPGGGAMTPRPVSEAIKNGELSQANVDDAVRRIIRTIIRVGLMDGERKLDPSHVNSPEHQQLALEAAEKGIVLLKNEKGILPLDPAKIHSIALIGPACQDWQLVTYGSAGVQPVKAVKAYDAIVARAGSGISITYSKGNDQHYTGETVPASVLKPAQGGGQGLTGEYFNGFDFSAPPALTRVDEIVDLRFDKKQPLPDGLNGKKLSIRWKGTLTPPATGTYRMNMDADSGARLYINDKLVQDFWPGFDGETIDGKIDLVAGQAYSVRIEYLNVDYDSGHVRWTWLPPGQDLFKDIAATASKADVAVVFVGSGGEGEFNDRHSMALPGVQNDMIHAVVAANPNTVVVLNNGGPVLVSDWIDQVPGLLEAFFPAENGGTALAKILFGDVNPSGKLTYTIAKAREDYPDFKHYPIRPGTFDPSKGLNGGTVDYAEGIYVGYRYFDKNNIEPSFPFGHGLSYTTFGYAKMKLSTATMSPTDKIIVTADITNTGKTAGAEVVQLYMKANAPKVDRPIRELKGFARVDLQPGETKPVIFELTARDLAYCDVPGKQWKADAGTYSLELGSSSRDLRAKSDVTLTSDYTLPVPGMGAPSPYAPVPSLTTGKAATASSVQEGYTADKAIDDDANSRWSSQASDPQWLAVDLGQPAKFDHARIHWEAAYARSYQLQTSDDGQNWTTIYTNDDGKGGSERISFPPAKARWIRIYGTRRGTPFGYSIYDFGLFPPQ